MTQLPPQAQPVLEQFQAAQGWEQRARLLLKLGQQLPTLPEEYKTEPNLVRGCESQVWCHVELHNNSIQLQLDTDARLLKGLLAALHVRIQGLSPQELHALDIAQWFSNLGLAKQLSPSRTNGLTSVIRFIQEQLE